jgi:Zn-dependent peptidase ImmA (M78 family)/transcriptional regulator with XRE-family HTH domain
MITRVQVEPALLHWASERSGHDLSAYSERFPQLASWATGESSPTLRQLENFARATHTPIGYLFLKRPPLEAVPLPDFRTLRSEQTRRPSADLLDIIYVCQQRQEWYRDFARSNGDHPLPFVGSVSLSADIVETAAKIRSALGFDVEERRRMPTWADALRLFIDQADQAGIMVMCSGVVLNNTHRVLDPKEFRGFAMADALAPLIFVNGTDSKAAQMFTLAHELAHVWLGQSALSDAEASSVTSNDVESWCNQVAAELLVPLSELRKIYDPTQDLEQAKSAVARHFKVSTLVALRRISDAGGLTRARLWEAYGTEVARLEALPAKSGGGNFHLTEAVRVSKRFARALVASTWEGRSSFTEAFRLLGIKRIETLRSFGESLGMTT